MKFIFAYTRLQASTVPSEYRIHRSFCKSLTKRCEKIFQPEIISCSQAKDAMKDGFHLASSSGGDAICPFLKCVSNNMDHLMVAICNHSPLRSCRMLH